MSQAVQRLKHPSSDGYPPTNRPTSGDHRVAVWVTRISMLVIVTGIVLIARLLPVENGVRLLTDWVRALGGWGPVAFGAVYIFAAVAFVPAAPLTLAAGAIFGLVQGTMTVSIASTVAAAAAFLISRHVARGTVERAAQRNLKFRAIDRAIGEGGWRIVALLRLSPAVPYSLGNYLYGLTAIRFWPYLLASWLAMLPGTFVYVYIGYLGGAGLTRQRASGEWALLVVGLLASVAVTIYVARLARKALRGHMTDVALPGTAPAVDVPAKVTGRASVFVPAVAALVAVATVYAYLNPAKVRGIFGPPSVTLAEAYQRKLDGPTFSHRTLDELLRKHVAPGGWVDYEGLRNDSESLDRYIESLARAPLEDLGRDERLALLINGYNAFTLRLILDHPHVRSIKEIAAAKRWADRRWNIGGHTWSLDEIEHEQIRPKFIEPRVHFALVCAAVGCPPLRSEAYTGSRIDEQLEAQAIYVHDHDRWFYFDPVRNVVHLTSLYRWYGGDFEQVAGSVLRFAARYSPSLKTALGAGHEPRIEWLDYDWMLNSKADDRQPHGGTLPLD